MISENITRYTFLHHGVCMHQKCQQGKAFSTFNDISALKLPLCGLVVFIDMNTACILTEGGRSSKTLLKENYAIVWTVVTYLLKNVKHGIEHDIDSTYGEIRLS